MRLFRVSRRINGYCLTPGTWSRYHIVTGEEESGHWPLSLLSLIWWSVVTPSTGADPTPVVTHCWHRWHSLTLYLSNHLIMTDCRHSRCPDFSSPHQSLTSVCSSAPVLSSLLWVSVSDQLEYDCWCNGTRWVSPVTHTDLLNTRRHFLTTSPPSPPLHCVTCNGKDDIMENGRFVKIPLLMKLWNIHDQFFADFYSLLSNIKTRLFPNKINCSLNRIQFWLC